MSDTAVERRIVTVLFADLVGFTTISERLDPEDVAAIQQAYFAAVRETIGRYRGQLEKFIGDAAMAVFGVPVANDDDAERAVRAGLAIVGAVEQLNARLGLDDGALRVRVGVNSGEAVHADAGPERGTVTGDIVNVAARLQTAAAPGKVLVGDATALGVAEAIELEDAGAVELKGKTEPTRAWTAVSVRPQRSRAHAMGRLRAPTLGRDRELRQLGSAFEAIAAGGSARALIIAPPGVGKTRLVDEFAARTRASAWRARLRPDVLAPYQAVGQLVREALGPVENSEAERVLVARLRTRGVAPDRAALVAAETVGVAWPGAETSLDDRESLFDAWLEGLDALSESAVVWIVEDAHWAGGDLLAFLDRARHAGSTTGRLIVVTARPALLERTQEAAVATDVLHLHSLSKPHAADLVRALVGEALPPEVVDAVAERSDGTPLFIEELLRTWISVGVLAEADGAWSLVAPGNEIPLPATVQSIYAAQLDDLAPPSRVVARRASVVGRRFPVAALEPLGVPAPADALDGLATRALLSGPSFDPLFGETYAYRHALLRDAAYASLARAERARLHVRLARWLETVAGDSGNDVAEVIARHYAAAVDEAPQLAATVDEGLERAAARRLAAAWYERAGNAAHALAAHDAAADLLRRSLELTDEDAPLERARRLLALGDVTAYSADMAAGVAAVTEAVELSRPHVDDDGDAAALHARASAALAAMLIEQIQFDRAREVVADAIERVRREDAEFARLLILRAHATLALTNDVELASGDAARAQAIARRIADPSLELDAQTWFARSHLPFAPGLTNVDWVEMEEAAKRLGRWTIITAALESRAVLALVGDRVRDVASLAERLRTAARTYGVTESIGWADYLHAEAAVAIGDWDDAIEIGLRAIDLAEANAYHRVAVRTWMVLAPMAAARRDTALAARLRDWYNPRRERLPRSPFGQLGRDVFDIAMARAGIPTRPSDAVDVVLASFAIPWGQPSLFAERDDILREWLRNDALDVARAAVTKLQAKPDPSRLGEAARMVLQARVALAAGSEAEAARAADSALAIARGLENPWWIAKAIRVLESAGAASPALADEAAAVEQRLRLAEPA